MATPTAPAVSDAVALELLARAGRFHPESVAGYGLTEFDTLGGSLLPVAIYLAINTVEGQFVTPMVIGRAMTMNPFVVLLGLAFWIWMWGALGGFIAIPALLAIYAIVRNVLPGADWLTLPVRTPR